MSKVYTPEEVNVKLKKGFAMSFCGMDIMVGTVPLLAALTAVIAAVGIL